jgi:hypothetical protein
MYESKYLKSIYIITGYDRTLTEGEGSVQQTSPLRQLVLLQRRIPFSKSK